MRHESEFEDRELTCVERGVPEHTFTWTARDQAFYEEKGFTPPRRCREHAQARRAYFDQHPEKAKGSQDRTRG